MPTKKPKTSSGLLHKYRPWKDVCCRKKHDKYTQGLLERGEIFFAPSNSFNDPFDSQIFVDWDATTEERRRKIREMLRDQNPSWSEAELERQLDEGFSPKFYSKWHGKTEKFRQAASDRTNKFMGVFCACKANDKVLMWSHYAGHHRGLCVGIRRESMTDLARQYDAASSQNKMVSRKVKYVNEFPKISYYNPESTGPLEKAITHKYKRWEYEHEHRVVIVPIGGDLSKTKELEDDDRKQYLPDGAITQIVFGIEFPKDERKKVKKLTAPKFPNIDFFQAVRQEREYAIHLDPINI